MDKKYIYEAMSQSRPVILEGTRITAATRQTVNRDLDAALKGRYFDSPGHAMSDVELVLRKFDLQGSGMYSAHEFLGDSGTRRFPVSTVGTGDELGNSLLVVSWGKAGDFGRYDVVAYLS